MSAIKPGSICVVVKTGYAMLDGRVCTADRPSDHPHHWIVTGSWVEELVKLLRGTLPATGFEGALPEANLRPIDDPSSATNSFYTCVVTV